MVSYSQVDNKSWGGPGGKSVCLNRVMKFCRLSVMQVKGLSEAAQNVIGLPP